MFRQLLQGMEKEFLTIKEAAQMLGVTPLTLRNWDKAGKFTASRHPLNNYRVYQKDQILMFVDDLKSKSWNTKNIVSKSAQSEQEEPAANKNAAKKLSVTHLEN